MLVRLSPDPKVVPVPLCSVILHPALGFPSAASLLFVGLSAPASRETAWIPALVQ